MAQTINFKVYDENENILKQGTTDIRNIGYITRCMATVKCRIVIDNFEDFIERKSGMKKYVKTDYVPEYCDYLTVGKEYEVLEAYEDSEGECFEFYDDNKELRLSVFEKTFHLNENNWTVIER